MSARGMIGIGEVLAMVVDWPFCEDSYFVLTAAWN